MVKQQNFKCDDCGKSSELRDENKTKFPYDDGWIYMNRIELKDVRHKDSSTGITELDMHFCKNECLLSYIDGLVEVNT